MGMVLGFFLLVYVLVAVGIYKLIKRFSVKKWIHRTVLAIFILIPTYDIIITNILGAYYCLIASPHPKTVITKKVEYPISIYWEDNVYPGFSKQDRELMIINYLDGVHLKTMALNGPKNKKVYIYHTTQDEVKKIKQKIRGIENTVTYNKAFTAEIMKTQKIYTKETMPKTNYTVTFNEVKLPSFARKFLYSDETKVIENNTSKVIAYNRRIMHFFYNITPDWSVGNRYYAEAMCGGQKFIPYWIFKYVEETSDGKIKLTDKVRNTGIHRISRNQKLYKKYIKGEM